MRRNNDYFNGPLNSLPNLTSSNITADDDDDNNNLSIVIEVAKSALVISDRNCAKCDFFSNSSGRENGAFSLDLSHLF